MPDKRFVEMVPGLWTLKFGARGFVEDRGGEGGWGLREKGVRERGEGKDVEFGCEQGVGVRSTPASLGFFGGWWFRVWGFGGWVVGWG